jgi:Zn-dependent protease
VAIITFLEVVYLIVTILVVGYIFTGLFNFAVRKKDVLDSYVKGFNWNEYWFACLVAAPGIILHELMHKFVALGFGLEAFYQISYFGLGLGVLLKLLGTGFLILAPGFVVISNANIFQSMMTALAGPLINLALWLLALGFLKFKTNMTRKESVFWTLTNHINKWLFIFNILPVPPLDGSKVWIPLFQIVF